MIPVFVPRIITYFKEGRIDLYNKFLKKVFELILLICIPAVVGIQCLSTEIITLIAGTEFAEAGVTMIILCPIIVITSMAITINTEKIIFFGPSKSRKKCAHMYDIWRCSEFVFKYDTHTCLQTKWSSNW